MFCRKSLRRSTLRVIEDWYEETERQLVRSHIKPHMRVLEVGAGKGAVTKELAELAEFVVACEPQTGPCAEAAKAAPGALVIQAAVGNGELMDLYLYDKFWAAGYYGKSVCGVPKAHIVVPTVPIEKLIEHFQINALICDAEGYEAYIIQTMPLDDIELIIAELHHDFIQAPDDNVVARKRLELHGFECVEEEEDRDTVHVVYRK